MLYADYHTHTTYSHGEGTPEEMVQAAIARGLSCIAISEHGPKHIFFGVRYQKLLELRREIDRLQDVYGDRIQIKMGLEANLVGDGLTDIPKDDSIFDFVLLGNHKGTWPMDALGRKWSAKLIRRQSGSHAQENAMAYAHAMARTKKLLGITHPNTYIPVDFTLLARAAAEYGVALEINESHRNMNLERVKTVLDQGASLFISSDAHHPDRVGEWTNALSLAREANALAHVINWRAD